MKKIPTIFVRDPDGFGLTAAPNPECQWVFDGQGVPTRKWDGTCCLIRDGKLFKRHDAKQGKEPPVGFEAAQDPDPITGHWPGWLPVGEGPDDRWFREGMATTYPHKDGTYELCGPKVQGNPEGFANHVLLRHGELVLPFVTMHPMSVPLTHDGLKRYFESETNNMEGIVFHHADGRMAKIKARDFGIKRLLKK